LVLGVKYDENISWLHIKLLLLFLLLGGKYAEI